MELLKLDLKALLTIARLALKDLTSVNEPDFRLEQAEFNKDKNLWEIVVSFLTENTNKRLTSNMVFGSEFQYHRIYKKLSINLDGEITGYHIFNDKE